MDNPAEKTVRRSPLAWVLVVEDFDDVMEEGGLGSLDVGGTCDLVGEGLVRCGTVVGGTTGGDKYA